MQHPISMLNDSNMEFPLPNQQPAQVGFSIQQIIAILLANVKLSIIIAVTITALGAIAIKLMPKSYDATATLIMDYQINDPLAGQEFPIGLLDSYMSTQMELMRSPDVLNPVIHKLELEKNETFVSGYKGDGSNLDDWIRSQLSKAIAIERTSQLINITAASERPAEAAEIANAVADSYLAAHHKRLVGPASQRAKRYTEMLAELKHKVEVAQDQVTSFRQRAGMTELSNGNEGNQVLLTMEQRLLEAQNARRVAEVSASGDQSNSTQVIGSNLIQVLQGQLSQKKSDLAKLQTTFGPQHPQILELKSEIEATQKSLNAQIQNYAVNAQSELQSARSLEQKLQRAVDEQRNRISSQRKTQEEGSKFVLELESAQAVYKKALDGYDQAIIASGGEYTNVQLVDHATVPLKASKPNKPKLFAVAFILSCGLGIVVPFALELLNRRVRCRDDIERDFNVPVLAEFEPIPASTAS